MIKMPETSWRYRFRMWLRNGWVGKLCKEAYDLYDDEPGAFAFICFIVIVMAACVIGAAICVAAWFLYSPFWCSVICGPIIFTIAMCILIPVYGKKLMNDK